LFLRSVVWHDYQLNKDITLVAETEVTKTGFSVAAGCALRDLQRTADFVELGRRSLWELEPELDVLM
jgi:hypothetical protein